VPLSAHGASTKADGDAMLLQWLLRNLLKRSADQVLFFLVILFGGGLLGLWVETRYGDIYGGVVGLVVGLLAIVSLARIVQNRRDSLADRRARRRSPGHRKHPRS
jgi:hypothetical protein